MMMFFYCCYHYYVYYVYHASLSLLHVSPFVLPYVPPVQQRCVCGGFMDDSVGEAIELAKYNGCADMQQNIQQHP
jgi:hypothetical protein